MVNEANQKSIMVRKWLSNHLQNFLFDLIADFKFWHNGDSLDFDLEENFDQLQGYDEGNV